METRDLLAKNLRLIREKFHFSQTDIAQYLNISQAAYSKFENSELIPSVELIKRLSLLYSIDEFTFYEENEESFITELAFAFKADAIAPADLQQIAQFNKIVRNYLNMCHELEKA